MADRRTTMRCNGEHGILTPEQWTEITIAVSKNGAMQQLYVCLRCWPWPERPLVGFSATAWAVAAVRRNHLATPEDLYVCDVCARLFSRVRMHWYRHESQRDQIGGEWRPDAIRRNVYLCGGARCVSRATAAMAQLGYVPEGCEKEQGE